MTITWTCEKDDLSIDSDFTVVIVRHCESCANVVPTIKKLIPGTKDFMQGNFRQPLCTSEGVKQSLRAGFILPIVLDYLGLDYNLLWGSSLLPRAIETSLLTSASFISSTDAGKSNPIFRVAYIKEVRNFGEKMVKALVGYQQSANISNKEVSETYTNAILHLFEQYNIKTKQFDLSTQFLNDVYDHTQQQQELLLKGKKKIKVGWNFDKQTIKKPMTHQKLQTFSDYKTFERDVLPLLVQKSKSMGFKGIVLFSHGQFIRDAINQPWDKGFPHKKKFLTTSKKRQNLSMHCIKYRFDGTTKINGTNCPKLSLINTFSNIDLHLKDEDGVSIRYKFNPNITSKTKGKKLKKLGKASLSGKTNMFASSFEDILKEDMVRCKYKFHKHILGRSSKHTRRKGGNRKPIRFTRKKY